MPPSSAPDSTAARALIWMEAAVLNVAVLKQTRVDVVLRRPTTVVLPVGPEEATELRFYVDDARALVAAPDTKLS